MATPHRPARLASIAAALGLVVMVAGCARDAGGPAITQDRVVQPFDSIELRGAAAVDVLVGEQQSLVVEGSPRTLETLDTAVRGQRLVIEHRGTWFWRGDELRVRVTVPELRAVELDGAGSITVIGLSGGETSLVLSGAGRMEAVGEVDSVHARVNGAGSIDLSRLAATDGDVSVNGAGSIEVSATGTLSASVNGVGSVRYAGTPARLDTSINGVGSIRRR